MFAGPSCLSLFLSLVDTRLQPSEFIDHTALRNTAPSTTLPLSKARRPLSGVPLPSAIYVEMLLPPSGNVRSTMDGRRSSLIRGAAREPNSGDRCGDVCATMLDHRARTGAPNRRSHHARTHVYICTYVLYIYARSTTTDDDSRPTSLLGVQSASQLMKYGTGEIRFRAARERAFSLFRSDRAQPRREVGPVCPVVVVYRGRDVRRAVAPAV